MFGIERITMNKRNGEIDLIRFVFAIVIMLHHLGMRTPLFDVAGLHFQVINAGGFVVVFYFLTSGWLMAKSADSTSSEVNFDIKSIPKHTTEYMWKRYKHFLTWFIPAFILNMIWDCMNYGLLEMLKHTFYNIPNLLMLQQVGFGFSEVYANGYYVNAAWFLSSLMLCSLVIYPLILWKKDLFTRIIAPVVIILGFYVRLNKYGDLRGGINLWYPMIVMCMGCVAYEMSNYLANNVSLSKYSPFLHFLEISIYLLVIMYVCSSLPLAFEYPLVFLLFIAVTITFSKVTYLDFFDKPIFSFLGRASFPLYLLHEAIGINYIKIVGYIGINHNSVISHMVIYSLCIAVALIAEYFYENRKTAKR